MDKVVHDYGLDQTISTFDEKDQIENGIIRVQLKAKQRVEVRVSDNTLAIQIDTRDLDHWLGEPSLVVLVVYEGLNDRAFWLVIQDYAKETPGFLEKLSQKSVVIRIPAQQVVSEKSLILIRERKNLRVKELLSNV